VTAAAAETTAMIRGPIGFLLLLLLLATATGPAAAADRPVDLELVLAVDVSRSIDAEEAQMQRDGYAAAFLDQEVLSAIASGMFGRIAVTYVEWSGVPESPIVPWTEIRDRPTAEAFSALLTAAPIASGQRTSISGAIDRGVVLFDGNGFEGTRRAIDVSGDGENNAGRLVVPARDEAVARGITINGLPIINGRPTLGGWPQMPDLDLYYRDCVIGGPGSFLIVAEGFEDFARAIRRKLVLEIAGLSPAPPRPLFTLAADRIAPPCDAGERRWRSRFDDIP